MGSINDGAIAGSTWLDRIDAAASMQQAECLALLDSARADLAHLRALIDAVFVQVADAFTDAIAAAGNDALGDAATRTVIMAVQHQDICAQLAVHLDSRLEHAANLARHMVPSLALVADATQGDDGALAKLVAHSAVQSAHRGAAGPAHRPGPVSGAVTGAGEIELF